MPKIVSHKEFISRATTIHNHMYDYTLLPEQLSTKIKVPIQCPIHGIFEQMWGSHLEGRKCPKCNWDNKKQRTQQKLLTVARKVHNDVYDYSQVNYVGPNESVTVLCKKHGPFNVRLWNHVGGPDGCPLCGSGKKRTTHDFVILAKEVHGDLYDYSQVKYTNAITPVTIICKIHGSFEQSPDMHCFSGYQGCPRCKTSRGERKIYNTLVNMGIINFVCEKSFDDLRAPNTNFPLRYDFFVPSYNLLIEFDGQSHSECVNYSGQLSEEVMKTRLERVQELDKIKNKYAKDNNLTLLRIPYTEFENIPQILSEHLGLVIN